MTQLPHGWPEVGSLVGGITLPLAGTARPTPLITGRGPTVIVFLWPAGGAAAMSYPATQLGQFRSLAEWGARLVVVVLGSPAEAAALVPAALAQQFDVLADSQRVLGASAPAVLVADEWGEVFFACRAEDGVQLPTPEELREWIVFVAVQCPECEGPEGPWRDLHAPPRDSDLSRPAARALDP